jgi:hypothetical protein
LRVPRPDDLERRKSTSELDTKTEQISPHETSIRSMF